MQMYRNCFKYFAWQKHDEENEKTNDNLGENIYIYRNCKSCFLWGGRGEGKDIIYFLYILTLFEFCTIFMYYLFK